MIRMLEEALPEGIRTGCDAVENITWTPNVTIRNNLSEYVPTRGILCTTRGKVVIEKNVFRKHGMAAILLEDDARGWFESGLIRDMTIICSRTGRLPRFTPIPRRYRRIRRRQCIPISL